jgi:hypothetical protein
MPWIALTLSDVLEPTIFAAVERSASGSPTFEEEPGRTMRFSYST